MTQLSKNMEPYFKISVIPGGCSGFSYVFDFTSDISDSDVIISNINSKINIIAPQSSMSLIQGSKLCYSSDDLNGSYFYIENPNATSKCGCGNSFSVF